MRTRKSVTSKDILPGTISGGTKKLTYRSINVYQLQETKLFDFFEYKSLFDYNSISYPRYNNKQSRWKIEVYDVF